MTIPRVTWLLPVKNGMPYLPETLASIKAQTYQNWEVLAWDNGSTDGSLALMQEWIPASLPGLIVADNPQPLGVCLAEMVKRSQTSLCARIDADDINVPNRLDRQVSFLDEHPEVAVVGSQMERIDEQGKEQGRFYYFPLAHDDIVNSMLTANALAHPTVVFRREAIIRSENYIDAAPAEDYNLWLKVATNFRLANLDESLVKYRIHSKSVTQTSLRQNSLFRAANAQFIAAAPDLYGCTQNEARLLRERKHPFASYPLYRIARHLQNTQGGTLEVRLRSPSFLASSRSLVAKGDIIARLGLAALSQQKLELPKELFRIGRDAVKHFQKS